MFKDSETALRPLMTRDQFKALWLHRAVVGKMVADPELVLARMTANLERLRAVHPTGMTAHWLDRWSETLGEGTEAELDMLTAHTPLAMELRQNSPFAGVLTQAERQAVLTAFASNWRQGHAARSST
jgi:hypothetical protein